MIIVRRKKEYLVRIADLEKRIESLEALIKPPMSSTSNAGCCKDESAEAFAAKLKAASEAQGIKHTPMPLKTTKKLLEDISDAAKCATACRCKSDSH